MVDDVNMQYNPANLVDDFGNFKMGTRPKSMPEVEVIVENKIPQSVCDVVAVDGCWESLAEEEKYSCLCSAFM